MFCSKNFRPALYPPIPVSPYTIHSYFCYIFPWTRCVKQVGYFLKKAARTFYVISYVHVTSLCRFLFIVSEINNISSRLAWVFYLWAVVMTSPVLYLFNPIYAVFGDEYVVLQVLFLNYEYVGSGSLNFDPI